MAEDFGGVLAEVIVGLPESTLGVRRGRFRKVQKKRPPNAGLMKSRQFWRAESLSVQKNNTNKVGSRRENGPNSENGVATKSDGRKDMAVNRVTLSSPRDPVEISQRYRAQSRREASIAWHTTAVW